MKKKIIIVLSSVLCACLCASFVACKKTDEHKPQAEWSYDAENHWHACATYGHTDKTDEGAHRFGDVMTIQTGDTADSIKQVKTCEVCGYEVFSELKLDEKFDVTPAVPAGDEASVGKALSKLMSEIEKSIEGKTFDYSEYVPDAGGYFFLTDEDIGFERVSLVFSDVDFSEPGYKTVTAVYNGTKCDFDILLTPDLSGVEKVDYEFSDGESGSATIYANGYLSLNHETGLKIFCKWENVDTDNCIIAVYQSAGRKAFMIIDDENGKIDFFFASMLGGAPGIYTIENLGLLLNVYTKNGKSYCDYFEGEGDELRYLGTLAVVYPSENTIVIETLGAFSIDDERKLTSVKEDTSYTGEFVKDGKTYKVEYVEEDKTYYIYLVEFDEETGRTETLTKAVLYAAEKDGMVIYVISFVDKTVKRYSDGIFKGFLFEVGE